jgi:UDP-GlcNAc:undecaprenyl-phosphate GlcNAc-1-phosphate transferase
MPESALLTLLALAIAGGLTFGLGLLADKLKLVDRPDDELKGHGRVVPITGGIAVLCASQAALALGDAFDPGLLVASVALLALGLFDDLRGLSPLVRLAGAAVAGAVLWLLSDLGQGIDALVLTVGLVVVAVNAVNLLDGADGVAGSAGMFSAVGLAFLAWERGTDSLPALVVAGAIGGFLVVNWPPARAFLGDGGAYVVGCAVAYLIITSIPSGENLFGVQVPRMIVGASLLGVFLVDLAVTLTRRTLSGAPLFGGDRSHVYDQLASRSWSPTGVASTVGVAQLFLVGVIVIFDFLLAPWWAVAATVGLYLVVFLTLWAGGFISPGRIGESGSLQVAGG